MKNLVRANLYYLVRNIIRNLSIYMMLNFLVLITILVNEVKLQELLTLKEFLSIYNRFSVLIFWGITCSAAAILNNIWKNGLVHTEVMVAGSRENCLLALLIVELAVSIFFFFGMMIFTYLFSAGGKILGGDIQISLLYRYIIIKLISLIKCSMLLFMPKYIFKPFIKKVMSILILVVIYGGAIWMLNNSSKVLMDGMIIYSTSFQCIASLEQCEFISLGMTLFLALLECILMLFVMIKRFERMDLSKVY